MNALALLITLACSASKVDKMTTTTDLTKLSLKREASISAHYEAHSSVSSSAEVKVERQSNGSRRYYNDKFDFTVDKDGGSVYNKHSKFYIGTFTQLSALGGSPKLFSFGKSTLKGDKDYVKDILHYNLITKARESGADAILGDISYEWEITDNSETQTYLFGLISIVVSQNLVYKAKAYSKTAKLVMDPYKNPETEKKSKPSLPFLNGGGGNGEDVDLKLKLDIKSK